MKYLILALAIVVTGCTGGPGEACDPCATAEANPTAGFGGAAAAAAARGGQSAEASPYARDMARLAPQTTVGRGAGATSSNSQDRENREVASGGAQNIAVLAGTNADAQAGGGVNPAVAEAAKTVAAYRAMLQLALGDPTASPDRVEVLSAGLARAQETLAAATAASTSNRTVNNNFQGSTQHLYGVSSSSTDGRPDPEAVAAVARAASGSATRSPASAEAPETPPGGEVPVPVEPPPAPPGGGGS